MRVVFIAPVYPPEMLQYTRGLAEVGAEVYGVGDTAAASLAPSLKRHLTDYLQVPRLLDEDDVIARVHAWLRGRDVDTVLANWEPLVLTAARLRERFGMGGMSVDAVRGFRDKQLMKERVRAAERQLQLRDLHASNAERLLHGDVDEAPPRSLVAYLRLKTA